MHVLKLTVLISLHLVVSCTVGSKDSSPLLPVHCTICKHTWAVGCL